MAKHNRNDTKLIKADFQEAAGITRKYARTFYFASHFLDPAQKKAAYAVYAVCRLSDDAVDSGGALSAQERLLQMRDNIELAYCAQPLTNDVLVVFRETVKKYDIAKIYFGKLLEGMGIDLIKNRYQNFEELYQYCYHVAGVVGLIMLKIFGYSNYEAELHAVELGIAMQLTNILRDIKEDFQRKRIYLPQDEMRRFGVSENDIARGAVNPQFICLMQFQIARAREFYARAEKGIGMISSQRSRFVVWAMKDIYAGILTTIERSKYDVFSQRVHVSSLEKIAHASAILIKGQYRWKSI
ncbi:MAG: phytoene/squalene synthase family protein [Candidatus Omnitrophota bacterium]